MPIWKRPEWMTESQYRILDILTESEKLQILSPSVIAINLDYDRSTISRGLSELEEHDLVEKIDDGYYLITDRGRRFVSGEIDPERLSG